MKTTCPHCSQHLELDAETLIALESASHFDCPTCGGAVGVPAPVLVPAKQTAPGRRGKPTPERVVQGTQEGMNRNILVLGVVALVAIGGVAIFLASKSGGNVFNLFQNTTNQIINNSYFTQLIADGVTTKEDLAAIAEIRPYGDGFIGVSKEALDWEQARDLAERTGSRILAVDFSAMNSQEEFVAWLMKIFDSELASPAWVREKWSAGILADSKVISVKTTDNMGKVLLHWRNGGGQLKPSAEALSFAVSHYQFIPASVPWEEARQIAIEMGGHLATITSKEENDWVLKTFGIHTPKHRMHFWIGGSEKRIGEGWRWSTGESFEYFAWLAGEPNDAHKTHPSYLNIYHSSKRVIGWNDRFDGDGYEDALVGFLVEWEN